MSLQFDEIFSQKAENYEFYFRQKFCKKIVKICLHLSYIVQNSFHFDEIFHIKFKNSNFVFETKMMIFPYSTPILDQIQNPAKYDGESVDQ